MLRGVAMTSDLVDVVFGRVVVVVCCGSVVGIFSGDDEWQAGFCRVVMLSW